MRVSVTTLECFRRWSDPEQEWMSEADLIATIKGVAPASPAMLLGSAFGKVLEDPDRYQVVGGYRYGDYAFSEETMAIPLSLIDRRGVFEAKAQKAYGACDVVAKADHLLGSHIAEFKTTTGTFDFDKYAASCQWRFMLDIFEASLVTYHVFRLDDHGNGVAELRDVETFNLYPYAQLREDCRELLDRFCSFVRVRGLDGFLRQRQLEAV